MKLPKFSLSFFARNKYVLLLITLAVILCVVNYQPGTWLTGWDTLHPEFNFWLNVQRVVFSVWRQEQGLGAVAIHSQMSDLPRILFLWIASVFLPTSFLRYFYIFACLVVGPVGVYYFLREVSLKKLHLRGHSTFIEPAAFLGGVFYLLNLVTLQQFTVPFEMFTAQYAALGWIFWVITRLFYNPKKKDWWWLIVITFLAAPQAYAATLFYAFFLCIAVYLGALIVVNRQHAKVGIRRAFWILVVILAINSFWLLPNIYAVLFHSVEVEDSKVNSLFSKEAFLFNQAYGSAADVAILRGFLFGWTQYVGKGNFDYVLSIWRSFMTVPILALFYGLFGFVIGGVVYTVKRRPKIELALLPVGIVCMIFLMNANPPFSWIFGLIRDHASLFKEALRTPYTKFSIILLFVYVVYFAEGAAWFLYFLQKQTHRWATPILVSLISLCFIVTMLPAFTGNLINPSMRVAIPQEYMQLNSWFSQQPNDGRVAELPLPSFWNWTYYDWGYQGAGFIWFGIPQPVLDRDFDRWSIYNEQYYRELSYAVYSQNESLFESLLEKYQIRYLLFDQHVIVPGKDSDSSQLYLPEIMAMLKASPHIHLAKQFSDKIAVYEYDLHNNFTAQTQQIRQVAAVEPQNQHSFIDWAYQSTKEYVSQLSSPTTQNPITSLLYFPVRGFVGQGELIDNSLVTIHQNQYTVTLKTPQIQGKTIIPDYTQAEAFLPANVFVKRSATTLTVLLNYGLPWPQAQPRPQTQFTLPLQQLQKGAVLAIDRSQPLLIPDALSNSFVSIGRITLDTKHDNTVGIYNIATATPYHISTANLPILPDRCSAADQNQVYGAESAADGNGLTIFSRNAVTCVSLPINTLLPASAAQPQTALVSFQFDYAPGEGVTPYYCLYNQTLQQCTYTSYGNPVQLVTSPNHFSDLVAMPQAGLTGNSIRLFLDSVNEPTTQELLVRNMVIAVAKPLATATVSTQTIRTAITQQSFALQPNTTQTLAGFLPENASSLVNDITRINRRPDNCSSIAPQAFDRRLVGSGSNRSIEYTAVEGTSCDHFDYASLPHDHAYLVAIDAKFVEGLPLRVCVSNDYTRRCDIYTELDQNPQVTRYYIFVPPNTSPGFGYDIDVEDYSIGSLRSTNELHAIHIYDYPANWLNTLRVAAPAKTAAPATIYTANASMLLGASVTVPNSSAPAASLVVLNQAYERGWLLYRLIGGIVPWPVSAQHVLVDNWQNGWLLTTAGNAGNQTYCIFFVPQLLYYLGVLAGVIACVVVWQYRKVKQGIGKLPWRFWIV